MTDHTKDLPRDPVTGDLIVKELVKFPLAELVHHLGQYGDSRAYDMAKRDLDARQGTTKADRDLAYEIGLCVQAGVYGSSW